MPYDEARRKELQTALDTKMASNQDIADSFKIEDGVVIVDAEQKSDFDQNMADIKSIQGLIENIDEMDRIAEWGTEVDSKSVAAEVDADYDRQVITEGFESVGAAFLQSDEF